MTLFLATDNYLEDTDVFINPLLIDLFLAVCKTSISKVIMECMGRLVSLPFSGDMSRGFLLVLFPRHLRLGLLVVCLEG